MDTFELSNGIKVKVKWSHTQDDDSVGYKGEVTIWRIELNEINITSTLKTELYQELETILNKIAYDK